MNIYVTTESENKLKTLFSNIKSFYILDVLSFISSLKLDMNKLANIYFINTEIFSNILSSAKLKKYLGIIYINKNLNSSIIKNLKAKFKNIKEINKIVLIDNGLIQKHTDLYDICEEVYFYDRFFKNKIVECQGLLKNDDGNSSLIMDI